MKISALVSLLVVGALVLGKAWITQRNERRFEERQEVIQKQQSEEARRVSSEFDAMQQELVKKARSGKGLTAEDTDRINSGADAIVKQEKNDAQTELGGRSR